MSVFGGLRRFGGTGSVNLGASGLISTLLEDVDFSTSDMGDVSIWDVKFVNCVFSGVEFDALRWKGVVFENCEFVNARLCSVQSDISDVGLDVERNVYSDGSVLFRNCNLSGAAIDRCCLEDGYVFEDCDLTGASLSLRSRGFGKSIGFRRCNLTAASLDGELGEWVLSLEDNVGTPLSRALIDGPVG